MAPSEHDAPPGVPKRPREKHLKKWKEHLTSKEFLSSQRVSTLLSHSLVPGLQCRRMQWHCVPVGTMSVATRAVACPAAACPWLQLSIYVSKGKECESALHDVPSENWRRSETLTKKFFWHLAMVEFTCQPFSCNWTWWRILSCGLSFALGHLGL